MDLKTASDYLGDMEDRLSARCRAGDWNPNWEEAVDVAKNAMSYRKLTPPLEQAMIPFSSHKRAGICPRCGGIVNSQQDYCDCCGQALDWEEFVYESKM